MTSKEIYKLVNAYAGYNIGLNTRGRRTIYYRSIANKLSRHYTNESLNMIGLNYTPHSTHASVLNSVRKFDQYIKETDPINMQQTYDSIEQIILVRKTQRIEDLKKQVEKVKKSMKKKDEKQELTDALEAEILIIQSELIKARERRNKRKVTNKYNNDLLKVIDKLNPENLGWFITRIEPIIRMQPKKFVTYSNI